MAEGTANKVQISFRLNDALKAKLDVKLAHERRDQQEALGWLVQEWVEGKKSLPERTGKWHDMLADILASGDKEAIDAIQYNLRVFHRVRRDSTKKALTPR